MRVVLATNNAKKLADDATTAVKGLVDDIKQDPPTQ